MTVYSSQDRYRLEREIGQGAMGQVWLATDTLLDRPVGVKYPLVTSSVSVGQLLQEARMLAPLNHPNITTLYDFFVEPSTHRFYLVMEYVDGKSLDTIIEGGYRLSFEISLELAQGLLRALSYAHGQGVIHRDIKPANVLIADEVKLTDFGLANLAALLERGTGLMAGTPAYMAPEQIEGRPTDGRADLYSLGVVLFELLSGGHLPFDYTDEDEMMEAHLHTAPPPLSQFVPDIPPTLEQIILRLLAKDPAERYPSAEAVMDVLGALHVGPKLGNLTVPLTPFIGREAELAEIQDRLQDPACRLLTLVGPGGSGKTALALEAATAQIDNYAQGVFFVSLAPLDSVDSLVPTVAEALGFRFYEEGEAQQQLLDYLRQKNMLLIMDNFEHLVEGAGLMTEILRTAAEVKILVTSRVRLSVQGEHPFAVAGMSFPDREIDEDTIRYSAVRLFLTSVHRVQPKYEPSAGDLTDVARICRLVEGMPLAILLAAGWMEMLTPAEITAEVGQSLDFLDTDLRDLPARQRSLRAVFDHSWHLLTEREQEVFQALSVFRGGFTRQAAQQVTGISLRELMALINKSLVHHVARGRYEMHELLRQFAAEKLNETPAASEAARDRHSAYYCAALQRWAVDLKGARQQTALTEMDAEIENTGAAWNWAVERAQVEKLDHAIEGLGLFYDRRIRYQEGEAACRLATETLAPPSSGDELRVWAKILTWQSSFDFNLGRAELASQLLRQSLALLEEPELAEQDTRSEKAVILRGMGWIVGDPDLEKAKQLWEQSLALYQALGDRWGSANVLSDLGRLADSLGVYGNARQVHDKSLMIRQTLGDKRGIAKSLRRLARSALGQGQLDDAERLMRESCATLQETGDRAGSAHGLLSLGWVLLLLGKYAESHSLLEESLAIWNDLGSPSIDLSGYLHLDLGWAKVHLGKYEQARAQGQMGLAICREIGAQWGIGLSQWVLGLIALAGEAYAEAQGLLQESVGEMGSWAHASFGYAARGLGDIPQAQQHLSEALRTTADTEAFWHIYPLITALPAVALLLADRGEKERAVELYALALRYGYVANSRWFEDVAGRHIAAIAATLPPEVVAAAQERGRARDLWATSEELMAELAPKHNSEGKNSTAPA